MAWSAPATYTSGQTLTAAAMNLISGNLNYLYAGHPVFTNETARNAAIPSPVEGQAAYLTAATTATANATGTTTAVPTGVTTIWNGATWVCVTPVGSYSNTSGSTTNAVDPYVTTLTGDATAVSVTTTTGTTALIHMTATVNNNTAAQGVYLSVAVSGSTTIAASANTGTYYNAGGPAYNASLARTMVITGLTAGSNTFTLAYKVTANTGTYGNRSLVVQGIA